jgi:hypothetical protein
MVVIGVGGLVVPTNRADAALLLEQVFVIIEGESEGATQVVGVLLLPATVFASAH